MEEAKAAAQDLLPALSKERYDKTYNVFKSWVTKWNMNVTEVVIMAFFQEMAKKHKPTTLWAYYSMLKSTLRANDNMDIGSYKNLTAFLKSTASGYSPIKASVFSEKDIQKFMNEAPDELYLDAKVICIFAVSGACNSSEMPQIKLKDVENHGDVLLVRIAKAKSKPERSFTITGTIRAIVQKYAALRDPSYKEDRFFLNYQRGKCTQQVIGKNKFSKMPRKIAKFLQLPNPDSFTGNSFRRTSLTFQKTSAKMLNFGCIDGPSNPVGHNIINESIHYAQAIGDPLSSSAASSSLTPTAASRSYYFRDGCNGSTDPLTSTKDYANQVNRKFGEIFCNPMGVLTYHCTLCPAQMDHSDEFSLHYMTHFRDVFPIKQEAQNNDPNDYNYGIAEPIEPISEIKLEEPEIKSEPVYYNSDDGDDDMGADDSLSEIE